MVDGSSKGSKVLILSASAGAGHVRAADAIFKICRADSRVAEVEHWDMLKYTNRLFRHIYSQVYLDLINRAPKMLGWIYDTTDTPWRNEKKRLAFEKFNAGPFLKAVTGFNPDLIICTHFTPSTLVGWLYEVGRIDVRPAICVTDFDCHAMWLAHTYQYYFLALEETRVHMHRLGIDPPRMKVTGIPIDPAFMEPMDKQEARRRHGLKPDRFTILVSAGGYGVGPVELLIAELLRIKSPVQVIVIAGRSQELKAAVEELAGRHNTAGPVELIPVGYTTQMHEFMAAADLLIGKPGGLTTSEAMARQLPMCIVNPIPGQEERNSDHLLELGVAIRCNNLPTLAYKIEELLHCPDRLAVMRANTVKLSRPAAAREIVETVMSLPKERRIEQPHRWPFVQRSAVGRRVTARRLLRRRRGADKQGVAD